MALDGFIFDVDGTLIDTNSLHAQAWEQAFEEYGFSIPAERIVYEIGQGGDRLVPSLIGESAAQEHGEVLRDAHGDRYLELIETVPVSVFPQVEALFEAVKERGLQVAIATASQREHFEQVLEQAGLDLFEMADEVVTDSDVEESKPHPDTVSAAVRKLGLAPGQCVMVGDTPYDAEACLRAGVVCLGLLTGVHDAAAMRRAGARTVYDDPADLLVHLDEALRQASPNTISFTEERVAAFMEEALEEARAGLEKGELPIGSVLLRGDGVVLGRGHDRTHTTKSRVAHAELQALESAASQLSSEAGGLVLVSTVEPCIMCFGAAIVAGVDTVIYGVEAPETGGTRRCAPTDEPDAYLPRVIGNVRADESRALLAEWRNRHPEDTHAGRLLEAVGA